MPSLSVLPPQSKHDIGDVLAQLSKQSEQLRHHSERLKSLEHHHAELRRLVEAMNSVTEQQNGQTRLCEPSVSAKNGDLAQGASVQNTITSVTQSSGWDESIEELPSRSDFLTREKAHGRTLLFYKWRESIWDASLFIGTQHLSIGASFVITGCLFFTISLTAAFVSVLSHESLTGSDFDEESKAYLELWRTTVAHDVSHRNSLTGESLASGVCNGKLYLPSSNLQIAIGQELEDYLVSHNLMFLREFNSGSLMCSLALCVWYLTLTAEFRDACVVLRACLGLPYDCHTRFQICDRQHVRLLTISGFRRSFMIFIFLLRLALVLLLGWHGTFFLLYETSVAEMILNAVGLEFILRLDELTFFALLAKVPQAMISRIVPLEYRRIYKRWNTYGEFMMLTFALLVGFGCVYLVELKPFVKQLRDNYEALCGGVQGSLDFVVAVDGIGIPWAAATPSSSSARATYAEFAVSQAVRLGFPPLTAASARSDVSLEPSQRKNIGLFMQVASADILARHKMVMPEFQYPQDWENMDPQNVPDIVGWDKELNVLGPESVDFGDQPGTVYNHYLRFLLDAPDSMNVSCAQVSFDRCVQHGSMRHEMVMRKLCPGRCGCATPLEGTISNPFSRSASFGFMGCATWNLRRQPFVDALETMPCVDSTDHNLFASWSKGAGDATAKESGSLISNALVAAFENGGCPEVAQVDLGAGLGAKICEESSLPTICPESCGCNSSAPYTYAQAQRVHFCPYSCKKSRPLCMTTVGNHSAEPGAFGPLVGYACVFPFKYKSISYDTCTSEDWSGPWCAVTVKDGVVGHWGDCDNSAPCIRAPEALE